MVAGDYTGRARLKRRHSRGSMIGRWLAAAREPSGKWITMPAHRATRKQETRDDDRRKDERAPRATEGVDALRGFDRPCLCAAGSSQRVRTGRVAHSPDQADLRLSRRLVAGPAGAA